MRVQVRPAEVMVLGDLASVARRGLAVVRIW